MKLTNKTPRNNHINFGTGKYLDLQYKAGKLMNFDNRSNIQLVMKCEKFFGYGTYFLAACIFLLYRIRKSKIRKNEVLTIRK